MENKTLAAAILLMVLLFMSVGYVGFAIAQRILDNPSYHKMTVSVQEPQNKVYSESAISLVFSHVISYNGETSPSSFYYVLDGIQRPEFYLTPSFNGSHYKATISGLSDGNHTLIIYVHTYYVDNYFGQNHLLIGRSRIVEFSVNAADPKIQILFIANLNTYNRSEAPLVFSVNEPAAWMGYCLENNALVTISGNTTISGLSEGLHSLVVMLMTLGEAWANQKPCTLAPAL